jgi:hypothetical protein
VRGLDDVDAESEFIGDGCVTGPAIHVHLISVV